MVSRDERRAAAIEHMAAHLLAEGLAGASLRPLARAAGTSDRMLLYYFADRDELLAATLTRIAGQLAERLDTAVPPGPRSFDSLREASWAAVGASALRPYMRLWLEIATAAARGAEPYRAIAGAIAEGFVGWAEQRLAEPDPATRRAQAALLVATIDGLLLLDVLGRRDLADAASGIHGAAAIG